MAADVAPGAARGGSIASLDTLGSRVVSCRLLYKEVSSLRSLSAEKVLAIGAL